MQLLMFLIVGYDTTSNSLTYVSWYLAKHPNVFKSFIIIYFFDFQILKRVQEEIDQICGDEVLYLSDLFDFRFFFQELNYDNLSELKYMDCVIKEALRLNPLGAL